MSEEDFAITPARLRDEAMAVMEPVIAANAEGRRHPYEDGTPSMFHLASMLIAAAVALEEALGLDKDDQP